MNNNIQVTLLRDSSGGQSDSLAYAIKKLKHPTAQKNKILWQPHIAHICLCPPAHKPDDRQWQKSAIAQRFNYLRNMSDVHNKQTRSYNMSQIKGKDTKRKTKSGNFFSVMVFVTNSTTKNCRESPTSFYQNCEPQFSFTVAFGMDMITSDTLLFRKHGQSFGLTRLRATNKETWKTFLNLEKRDGKFSPSLNVSLKEINK